MKRLLSAILSMVLLATAMYVPFAFTAYADASAFEAQHMEVDFDGYDAENTYKIYQGVASPDSYNEWEGIEPTPLNGKSIKVVDFESGWSGGNGTKDSPYEITTAAQLAKLAWLCAKSGNSGMTNDWYKTTYGKYWVLTTDIVLNNTTDTGDGKWYENSEGLHQWYTTTTTDNSFNGHFDGRGHTIKGLYINSTTSGAFAGLFGSLGSGAVVENIKITDSYIHAPKAGAIHGGFNYSAHIDYSDTTTHPIPVIRNCYIDESVKIDGTNAGGITGYGENKKGSVENCYVGAAITGTTARAFNGGGWTAPYTITNSYSTTSLEAGHGSLVKSHVKVAEENILGAAAKTQMPNLDYANTWVTLPDSKPQLRVFCNKDDYKPCTVVQSETDKYMKIEKSAGSFTAGGEEYRVGFMLNPTGAANAQVYKLKAGGKYRVALNYIASSGVKVAAYSANSADCASVTDMVSLGSQALPAAEDYSDFSFEFTVPEGLDDSGVNALYLAFETEYNYDGTTSFAVNVTDVVVDRLGTITVDDGTDTQEYVGVPACNVADAPYSECAAEVLNLPKSAVTEKYAYTTDPANATATAYGLAYYNDEAKTKEITEPITFTADDKTVYAETKTVVDTTYQMAFTGFENDVYKSRKPEPYYTGVSYYDMPGVVFRGPLKNGGSESGLEITKEDAYTGSSSMKYDSSQITKPKSNYRAIYIGNRFEFTPERTYAISFYVKAAKGNTASSVKFAVRGGVSCSEWSDRNNNVKSANVPLTENWQKVTINYKPNKHTNLASGITNENAYYVPQLCVDYGQLDGKYTEGAKFYIDTLSIDVLKGDCNGDGERDILDLVRIKKISLDSENGVGYVAEELKAANFDSTVAGVDAQDVTAFKKGILSNFQ